MMKYRKTTLADLRGLIYIMMLTLAIGCSVAGIAQETRGQPSEPGEVLWSTRPPAKGERHQRITTTPAIGEDRVYVGTIRGLYAIRKKDGAVDWRFKKGVIYHNFYSAPVIAGDRLYTGSTKVMTDTNDGNKLYCINKNTGREIWSRKMSGGVHSSPAIYRGRVYVGNDDGQMYALDARTGKKYWSFQVEHAILSTPAVAQESLVFSSADQWYCLNTKNGKVKWTFNGAVQYDSACIHEGQVYLIGEEKIEGTEKRAANLYGLDLNSGEQKWKYDQIELPFRTPVIDTSAVYVGGLKPPVESPLEHTYLYRINKKNGQLVWTIQMPYNRISDPSKYDTLAIGASRIIFSGIVEDHTAVFSYDKQNGTLDWKTELEGYSTIQPVMDEGKIYVCDDNTIYCLSAGAEQGSWPYFRGNQARTGSPPDK